MGPPSWGIGPPRGCQPLTWAPRGSSLVPHLLPERRCPRAPQAWRSPSATHLLRAFRAVRKGACAFFLLLFFSPHTLWDSGVARRGVVVGGDSRNREQKLLGTQNQVSAPAKHTLSASLLPPPPGCCWFQGWSRSIYLGMEEAAGMVSGGALTFSLSFSDHIPQGVLKGRYPEVEIE